MGELQTFTIGALPPGVAAPKTAHEKALYRSALDFEGVFTQHLVDEMTKSAQGDDDDGSGGMAIYQDMVNQTLNGALESGGGLGLAGTLYASMKQAEQNR
jgi:Rod binding domain-containing protein